MNKIEDVSLVGCVYELPIAGISVDVGQDLNPYVFDIEITKYFLSKGLFQIVERNYTANGDLSVAKLRIKKSILPQIAPNFDTLTLWRSSNLLSKSSEVDALEVEILLTLLASPVLVKFKNIDELISHVRIRKNIALAARRTKLAFRTNAAERPEAYWSFDEERGFTLKEGADLVTALLFATQPEVSGSVYDFSCTRATEYIVLLGLAQEAKIHSPDVYHKMSDLNKLIAVRGEEFREVYLDEIGSMGSPLPHKYYVPGDRIWFKNPDQISSDAIGYEGSWCIYLGGGRFSNFWSDEDYTLERKCIEIYHWRDGAFIDSEDRIRMDEAVVEREANITESNSDEAFRVINLMMRYRDSYGIYMKGGVIDTTREAPKSISEFVLKIENLLEKSTARL